MLDIIDRKTGKVVAILMDDGSVIKKDGMTQEVDDMIKEHLGEVRKERKKK